MRYISTFSGIEAASVAWEGLGWEPICFSEIDEFPSAVLAHRYPDVPNLGDITKVDWKGVVETYGRPDVLVGGSPCQSFSIAAGASRTSLDGKSNLMLEYIRACEEVRSPWILWENVCGVLNTRDNAFRQLIDALQGIGYVSLAWRVLDAQFFGVAQRRRRVFLVGHLGTGGGAAAVLFESESVRGNTQSSKQKREELARASERGDGADGRCLTSFAIRTAQTGANGSGIQEESAHTVDTNGPEAVAYAVRMREGKAGGGKGPLVQTNLSGTIATGNDQTLLCQSDGGVTVSDGTSWVARRFTPTEYERLQGFPDGWTDVPFSGKEHPNDTQRYKAIGNSMAVPVMRWIGERIQMADGILKSLEKGV